MSKFEQYLETLDEGILSADSITKTIGAKTEEEATEKLNDFLKTYKEFNPRPANALGKITGKYKITADKGKFYYTVVYDKVKEKEDSSIKGLAKRAGKAIAKGYRMGTLADVKVEGEARSEALAKSSIEKQKAKILKQYPKAEFGEPKIKKSNDGNFYYYFYYKRPRTKEEAEKGGSINTPVEVRSKETSSKISDKESKINNITKQLKALSDGNIANLEKWIKDVKNREFEKKSKEDWEMARKEPTKQTEPTKKRKKSIVGIAKDK